MAAVAPVAPTSSVLVWARVESGYDPERVAKRLGVKPERLTEWEAGERVPTMRQMEDLAKFYHRPLGIGVSLEEARGVSLLHWPLPVAGVNSKEMSPEARSFTLMHEVVHLMLAGNSNISESYGTHCVHNREREVPMSDNPTQKRTYSVDPKTEIDHGLHGWARIMNR